MLQRMRPFRRCDNPRLAQTARPSDCSCVFRRGVDMAGASHWRRAGAAGLGLAAAIAGAAHATPLPIKAFFEVPASRGAQLSPSGRYLALIETTDHGDVVSVLDLQT